MYVCQFPKKTVINGCPKSSLHLFWKEPLVSATAFFKPHTLPVIQTKQWVKRGHVGVAMGKIVTKPKTTDSNHNPNALPHLHPFILPNETWNLMRQWIHVIQLTITGKKAKAYIYPLLSLRWRSNFCLKPANEHPEISSLSKIFHSFTILLLKENLATSNLTLFLFILKQQHRKRSQPASPPEIN